MEANGTGPKCRKVAMAMQKPVVGVERFD